MIYIYKKKKKEALCIDWRRDVSRETFENSVTSKMDLCPCGAAGKYLL